MNTIIRKVTILFILLGLTTGFVDASEVVFEVSGWVKKDDKKVKNAIVRVYEENKVIDETVTNIWVNFTFFLEADKEYYMTISSEGAKEKSIVFHTHTDKKELQSTDFFFEFIVDLYEAENLVESSFHQHMVMFDADVEDFIYLQPIVSENLMMNNLTPEKVRSKADLLQNPEKL